MQEKYLDLRFQTTYEELKRDPETKFAAQSGFQTTYEELKRDPETKFAAQSGFQTTYEELKRLCRRIWFFFPRASRLPMRNWNTVEW